MSQDMISAIFWILGGLFGVVSILLGTLWSMTRKEKEAQDAAIEHVKQIKADKAVVEDNERRWDKEMDRIRFEHDKVIDRVENRFEKELAAMENRLGEKIDLILEILKKDRP